MRSGTEDAYDWAIRLDAGRLSRDDQTRLNGWLAGDPRRKGALLKAEAALALVDRAQAVRPMAVADAEANPSRRSAIAWSATVLAAGSAGLWFLPRGEQLDTRVGEVRASRLADASVVTLNTQSRVMVNFRAHRRDISLDRGEAWFQVAHDRTRPFIVSVADLRVRAVGTAFSVRRMDHGVEVLVTEGTVEVWRADQPRQRASVSRDHRVFVPADSIAIVPVKAREGIERALAWRSGRVAFAGEALDDAVAEINRYNLMQLRVDDPVLGRIPVVGYFRTDDPSGFARLIAASEGARVEPDGGNLRIIPEGS